LGRSGVKEKLVADNDPVETVAIIGAGIGGIYLAAELGTAGYKLRLHDLDDARLADIRAFGGIDVEGERGGFAAVERATTDLRSAIDGADVVIVVTGGNAQATVARSLAPLLRDGQVILLIQGNTGGSLVVRRALDDAGCHADVTVAEMDNYPYSCRRLAPTRIRPIVTKRWLQIAAFPGNRIASVHQRLSPLFPEAMAAPNALYTGFTNANAMLHVANCVANAARIESGDSYRFYAEGVTPAVARLYQAINRERVAVAAALDAAVPTLEDWFDRVYGVREESLVETCQRLTYNSDGPYQATGTPSSLDHKFITEDVPTGLIPMSALGVAAGVPTPAIDALIAVVRSMTGKDFAAEARTLVLGPERDERQRDTPRDGRGLRSGKPPCSSVTRPASTFILDFSKEDAHAHTQSL
jgi:opine dehydrogenase